MHDWGFWRLSAAQLLDGYARRDFTPTEVTRELLYRIDRIDRSLHAYLATDLDGALAAAQAAEDRWQAPGEKPLLLGVPVSVKDTIEMRGLPTTYGSLAFKDNQRDDSELVRRLRQAGAVILGKTNTPEFGLRAQVENRLGEPGANPWQLSHSCGGSSGGAAAAVASGLGPLAVGTDAAGSIRIPAAYNGVFGLKPSHQRIPGVQAWRAAPGRGHNGPLARTVRDVALLMAALAGPDARDPDSLLPPVDYLAFAGGTLRGARVALSKAGLADADSDLALDHAAALLNELGCTIMMADPPADDTPEELAPGVSAYAGDHYAAAEELVPGFLDRHKDELTNYGREVHEAGSRALAWQYRRILRRNRALAVALHRWFRDFEFLLCPVAGPACTIGARRAEEKLGPLSAFSHAGLPAASVPLGFAKGGLPVGVQVVGRFGDDVGVLRVAAAIEAARPWALKWPRYAEAA